MLALAYLLAGLAAVVTALAALAGAWWAVLFVGVALVAAGVLEARGGAAALPKADGQ